MILHNLPYALKPQFSATFYRIAAPGLTDQTGPRARGRDKIKDGRPRAMGVPIANGTPCEGVNATPHGAGGKRRRGVLLLICPQLAGRFQFWKYYLWLNREL